MLTGISRDKTIANKLIKLPNFVTQKYPFCRLQIVVLKLDTQLNEPTNQNSIKLVKPANK